MTKKDYERIALAIKENTEPVALVYHLMEIFEADNPRFDRTKFLTACGL
jgi:hypothetical protein